MINSATYWNKEIDKGYEYKMIRYILCRMLGVESVLLMIPVIVAALYQEMSGIAFLIPAGILLLLFFLAGVKSRSKVIFTEKKVW